MKVLVGPRVDLHGSVAATALVRALAGPDGEVVLLGQAGVRNLSRSLTRAEVALLRKAIRGPEAPGGAAEVGYVCTGAAPCNAAPSEGSAAASTPGQRRVSVIAVTDHVNLTWRSPLAGDNDDAVGPRFPSMTGIYAPETVLERTREEGGIIVTPGVVAGVGAEERLSAYESATVRDGVYSAVSAELVPVAIVAAHLGLRIAAAVMTTLVCQEEETVSGRS